MEAPNFGQGLDNTKLLSVKYRSIQDTIDKIENLILEEKNRHNMFMTKLDIELSSLERMINNLDK